MSSPSKPFNLSGLGASWVYITNPIMYGEFMARYGQTGLFQV